MAPQFEGASRIDLYGEKLIDLAQLPENDNLWLTLVRIQPSDDIRIVKGVVRVVLEVTADNYNIFNRHVFEISWDGEWVYDITKMSGHLTICKIING